MQVIELLEPTLEPMTLRFAPDGRLLAVWSWGRVLVLDTATGATRAPPGEEVRDSFSPAVGFTADGHLVYGHQDNQVCVCDVNGGQLLRECPRCALGAELGPGGRYLYVNTVGGGYRAEIARWEPATGAYLPDLVHNPGVVERLTVSRDEKWLATSNENYIEVWNIENRGSTEEPAQRFTFAARHDIRGLALSADGRYVAYNGPGVGAGDVRTGEAWSVARHGPTWSHAVAFHPWRPLLAFSEAGSEVIFYDALTRTEVTRFAWGLGRVLSVAFSEDGLRCVAGVKGRVVVWDVDV